MDTAWELSPTTMAVAITEPNTASGLTEPEKTWFREDLTQALGKEKMEKLLKEAEQFHLRVKNTRLFDGK